MNNKLQEGYKLPVGLSKHRREPRDGDGAFSQRCCGPYLRHCRAATAPRLLFRTTGRSARYIHSVVRVYTALCSGVWGRISESERPARVTG